MPTDSKRPKTARIGDSYYVYTGGESQGPYDLPFIKAMVISGMLAADVSISADGTTSWKRLDTLVPPSELGVYPPHGAAMPPPLGNRSSPPPVPQGKRISKPLVVAASILGAIAFFSWVGSNSGQPPSNPQPAATQTVDQTPAPPVDNTSAYQPPAPTPVATYTPPSPAVQGTTTAAPSIPAATTADASTPAAQDATATQAGTATATDTTPAPNQTADAPALVAAPPPTTYAVRDQSGKTYRVSTADYAVLTEKEQSMSRMMIAINLLKASRARQKALIESERGTLDDSQVDAFNVQVDNYNASAQTLDQDIDAYNAAVDDHNAFLVRVGTPEN